VTFGFSFACLGLVVLVPLAALFLKAAEITPAQFAAILTDPRTLAALRISFGSSFVAALVNVVFGLVVAWVLVRYRFPGRRILDAIVDLPFALPTAVAGVALSSLYARNGWVGSIVGHAGIKVAYTPAGIVVALIFVGLPFVVRTVQPVLEELDREQEEAAATLGAHRGQTVARVILPRLLPAVLAGFALAFARAVGEYGSVIFIAGNIPFVSEIAPLLIVIRLQEFNVPAASLIAAIMLVLSLIMLLVVNLLQLWSRRRFGDG
jgi:sulfate transport system permease protein